MTEWISRVEALARVTIRTGIRDVEDLLSDALAAGKVETNCSGDSEHSVRDEINLHGGGITWVDAEYDERLRPPQSKIDATSLDEWLSELLRTPEASEASPAAARPRKKGRRSKKEKAVAAYLEVYRDHVHVLPDNWPHENAGDYWVSAETKIGHHAGVSVSEDTLRTGLHEYCAALKKSKK